MKNSREIADHLISVRDYLRWGVSLMEANGVYFGHGTDNAWDECLALLQSVLHWPMELEPNLLDSRLLPEERLQIIAHLSARVDQRVPLPYITGRAWFAGLAFAIDRRAIIPRSPLAELIESCFEPWYHGPPIQRVLDLCAGSGCIGIACAVWTPDCSVDLVEISAEVADLAEENSELHGVQDRVKVWRSDLFTELPVPGGGYDLILSNPPYVDAEDMASMPAEFRHEPLLALEAGEDGLSVALRILRQAADYLAPQGLLVLELGNSAEALEARFPELPFTWVDLERGGEGILVATADELVSWQSHLGAP